jgi:flavin-dependent dehydrogenase
LGVHFILGQKVLDIRFSEEKFEIELSSKNLIADLVIGAFGKRSNLDQKLNRAFFYKRSPYVGVKYHIKTDFPSNTIQLDNFKGGYCGLSKIESDLYCLCYLAENKYLKQYGSIKLMEEQIVRKNPDLNRIFESSEFVWDQPETINEITFEKKTLVENHVLMCGDTAGMITPLCGNGMAIAIHAAKILSNIIIQTCNRDFDSNKRKAIEEAYQTQWKNEFALRLMIGRGIQRFFGNERLTNYSISGLKSFPKIIKNIVKRTHGNPF